MKIIKTSITKPPVMLIYGTHGSAKSSFASQCPKPIFIQTEEGLENLGVQAFEPITAYEQIIDCINFLVKNDHDYKTLVIDTLDWTEKFLWDYLCRKHGKESIAEFPFGSGYKLAEKEWFHLTQVLTNLNKTKKMMIVLLAHDTIVRFEDPERESYDRHSPDLHKSAAPLMGEWCDIIGFIGDKVNTVTKDGGFGKSITKAKGTGEKALFLERRPAFEAKNRFDLPASIPFPRGEMFKTLANYLWPKAATERRNAAAYQTKDLNLSEPLTTKQVENINKDLEKVI